MDQRPNVSLKNSTKPSKLLALIALAIAFALPFILVKSFPHKQKANYSNEQALLPPQTLETPSEKLPRLTKREPAPFTKSSKQTPQVSANNKPQTSSVSPPGSPKSQTLTSSAAKTTEIKSKPSAVAPVKPTTTSEQENELKTIKTRAGDSLASVFSRLGLTSQTLQTIIRENPSTKVLAKLKPNQQLQFLIKNHTLEKMIAPISSTQFIVVTRDGRHYRSKLNSYKTTTHNHYITATLRGSLYSTAKRHNIPYKLMQQMTEIFAWDINFAKDVRAGDQFTIIYKALFVEDKLVGVGDIVAVSYKNRGKVFQAVLHTSRSGHSDYYTPQGTSLKNAFNRYPLRFSHISSTFSLSRYHPILRYRRPHKGVDLAAPIGTPILATGDGRIDIIGRQSGYGNMIKIKHNKTYSTIYGHMLKFQKGLSKGTFVKRGQVIGYVGQTGLASGPHCHYEFHINNQPKNPTTVNLPRGNAVPTREMAAFKANTNTLLAQLKLYETGRLGNPSKRNAKVG
ncbi:MULTISPECIES: peptidoglycan DD-metalloendopeptidase family protein [Legionella]|uniref:M23/M37 family transporter peptidase n=1 Tax=Legionella maceachernii TaxID=466 RepID=A0A0W0W6F0_9GAMM|nr:peptidoglycan DD-metalloendopeptidase family protein [Legionella maceachernii]KTD27927.1 M23/M37 family transporter peptidase [Legionella maceachernii]SKA25684.1 Murein DD-endopeptidase MepM and murein hydrolase activator NlpD, contain LysM domain [Legionella maceachernii]SUP00044.1 Glycyl-glycine endopeptidase ALE-1 precursor [Legionella maceachernii]SUP04917.1 Glycyl-glycine endopeptidase ALE-1 precursor [Legionella maceachernii]